MSVKSTCADITRSMTQWPKYREIEGDNDVEGWYRAASLTPVALNNLNRVHKAAQKAADSIENGDLFQCTQYTVKLIKIYNNLSSLKANEVLRAYKESMKPLETEIADVANEQAETMKNLKPESERGISETQEAALKEKLSSLSSRLTQLNTHLQNDLEAHTQGPQSLANDRRTQEKYLKKLDLACRKNIKAYTDLLQKWEQKQYINKDVSFEDCCKWAGKKKALNRLNVKMGWLAQSLHKVACAVDALQANFGKTDFVTPIEHKPAAAPESIEMLAAQLGGLGLRGVQIRTVRTSSNAGKSEQHPTGCPQQ